MSRGSRVSVVLPVRNREGWVARALDSVLGQTHQPLEILVVDDGSTDGTAGVLARYGRAARVLRQPPRGPYAARNLGVRHAAGELVAFIDSDDAWLPERLAWQLPLLADPDVGLVFGDAVHVDHRGGGPPRRTGTAFQTTRPRRGRVARHFAHGNFVPTSSVLVRRRCLEEVGLFPATAPLSADYVTWYRIARRHRLDYVDAPVVEYTVHPGGISRDLVAALRARVVLFSELLGKAAADHAMRDELRHILFNLHLHLALARLRYDRGRRPGAAAEVVRALGVAPPRTALSWAVQFGWRQLGRRLARLGTRRVDWRRA